MVFLSKGIFCVYIDQGTRFGATPSQEGEMVIQKSKQQPG